MKKLAYCIVTLFTILMFALPHEAEAQMRNDPNNNRNGGLNGPRKPQGREIGNTRWFVDGNVGGNTRNGYLNIFFNPMIGYRITERASVAGGPIYEYLRRTGGSNGDYAESLYGANAFARYDILQSIFAHAEFSAVNYRVDSGLSGTDFQRDWAYRLPVGGGVRQRLAGRATAQVYVLYDLLYNADTSPFDSPLIYRGGVNFNF